jgi:hypothetical protein
MPRAALELAAHIIGEGDTELTYLIPRREYTKLWHRLLHDRSSNAIVAAVGDTPHCNVTIVPYHLGRGRPVAQPAPEPVSATVPTVFRPVKTGPAATNVCAKDLPTERTRIADLASRQRSTVAGRVLPATVGWQSGIGMHTRRRDGKHHRRVLRQRNRRGTARNDHVRHRWPAARMACAPF